MTLPYLLTDRTGAKRSRRAPLAFLADPTEAGSGDAPSLVPPVGGTPWPLGRSTRSGHLSESAFLWVRSYTLPTRRSRGARGRLRFSHDGSRNRCLFLHEDKAVKTQVWVPTAYDQGVRLLLL